MTQPGPAGAAAGAAAGEIVWLDQVDSTQDEANRRAAAGARGPLWIAAREQTKGRGRRGRSWRSGVRGEDLTASLLLRPWLDRGEIGWAQAATLSFILSLALADAVQSFGVAPGRLTLKWPNDVLLDGAKLSGLLIEAQSAGAADRWLAIGVGVNLASRPAADALDPGAWPAAALKDAAPGADAQSLLAALAAAMNGRYRRWLIGGFADQRGEWLARAARLGRPIEARLPHRTLMGVFRDVDEDGALHLETVSGRERVHAADVYFPCGWDAAPSEKGDTA